MNLSSSQWGYEALSAAQEPVRPNWDDFQCTSSIPTGALQLEHGAACDCDGTEGEQAGWRHKSSCCPGELQKASTLHFCHFSGTHPQPCKPAITHFKVINCWDIQRPFSCHSCSWRQELGNEFQQDNQILPTSCCNVLVLLCHPGSPVCSVTSALMARTQGQCHFERAVVVPLSGQQGIILPRSRNFL